MSGPWEDYQDAGSADQKPWETYGGKADAAKSSGAIRRIADQGIKLGQGIVGLPEAAVGIADLATNGRAGKAVESAGVRFKDARDIMGEYLSPEQKAADAEVNAAQGFLPTVGAMVRNPSTIMGSVMQSAPSMLGGAGVARGAMALAPGLSAITAGALGEGAISAGQNAEQVRQEDPNGTLTGQQSALLAGSGALTGAISRLSGGLSNKMGIGDVQTMLAAGKLGAVGKDAIEAGAKKGLLRKLAEGAINEGFLQELPQSYQEQVAQNLAQGKPWDEGAAAAGAQGMLAGAVMGGGGNVISHVGEKMSPAEPGNQPPEGQAAKTTDLTAQPSEPVAQTPITSQAMGLDPAAGPLSAAAVTAVDTGAHQEIKQGEANAAQQAAADQTSAEQDTSNKPITHGPIAEAALSPQDKQATLLDSQTAADEAPQFAGAQDGDILNGEGKPYPTRFAAQRRANMEGKDWTIAPVADGFVARRKEVLNGTTDENQPNTAVGVPDGSDNTGANVVAESGAGRGDGVDAGGPLAADLGNAVQYAAGTDAGAVAPTAIEPSPTQGALRPSAPDLQATQTAGIPSQDVTQQVLGQTPAQAVSQQTIESGQSRDSVSQNSGQSSPSNNTPLAANVQAPAIDTAAHEAATSPNNDLMQPTDGQKDAGNYKKGHVNLNGLEVSIENPAGSVRSGVDKDGNPWSNELQHHYGYIKGTIGADKDHVDLFVKPGTPLDFNGPVYVVDQVHPHNGKFDEHKVVVGAKNGLEARQIYHANYAKGWKGFDSMTAMPFDQFKTWVKDGPKNQPLASEQQVSQPQGSTNGPTPTQAVEAKKEGSQAPAAAGVVPQTAVPVGIPAATPEPAAQPLGQQVSVFNGKYGKGMNQNAAKLKAIELNRANTDKRIVYAAEEHNDPKLENPWSVIGRQAVMPKPEVTAKKQQGANNLRKAAYDKNPLLTFLATHGLWHDKDKMGSWKSEFSPDRHIMVPGYGGIFRKTGQQLSNLVPHAIQDGYLPKDGTESMLTGLIQRAIGGEKIQPMYAEGVAEKEMDAQIAARQEIEREQASEHNNEPAAPEEVTQAAESVTGLTDAELFALDDAIPLEASSNTSIADFLRAMGASEQEIQDAVTQEQSLTGKGNQGRAGTQETAASPASGSAAQGNESAQPAASEGLTAPSRRDILDQQMRQENAAALDDKAQIDKESSRQTLTQQMAPEQRRDTSGDMFAQEKAHAEIDKRNAGVQVTEDPNQVAMFARSGEDIKSSVLSKNGFFKSWPKYNSWTRSEYNDVVSLLPEAYRNDPHRQEPITPKDWDAHTAGALQELDTLNEVSGDGTFRIDSLGNILVDQRKSGRDAIIEDALPIAKKYDLGIFVTGIRTDSIEPLKKAGFVSEYGLGGVLQRVTGSNQAPMPHPDNIYGNPAYGTMMSYKPRGFAKPMFSRSTFARNSLLSSMGKGVDAEAMASRSLTTTQLQATKTVDQQVRSITGRWKNAPDVVVAYNMQDPLVPELMRQVDQKQRQGGANGTPYGFYFDGTVYVLAEKNKTSQDVAKTVFHEVLGHAGLRGVYGKALKPILQQIATLRRPLIIAKARQYGQVGAGIDVKTATDEAMWAGMSEEHRLTSAEEVLAEFAETHPEISFVKRAISAIRNWLREHGFAKLAMTDSDVIQQFILPARGWVERGQGKVGGGAAFSRSLGATLNAAVNERKTTITGETGRQYTPEQLAAFKAVGFQVETPSLKERAQALWKDAGKKFAQGVFDQFRPVRELSNYAYTLLRLSKGASGAFEVFLNGGKLKLTDGVYDFDEHGRGGVVQTLLQPLGGEHHDFFRWVAANRAERLQGEGKENLFSTSDIASLKTLADGVSNFDYTIQHGARQGQVTRDRTLIYRDSLVTFNEFNKNILDLAEQSGLIDGGSRKVWEHEFYVPFYRVADDADGGVRGMNVKGGVVRQQAFKTLKGGKNALNADLLDNTLMNWAHLLDAAAKNRAAKATIEAAEAMGVAVGGNQSTLAQMGASINNKNGVVWFMDGGQKRYSLLDKQDGPYLMTALTALEYAGMRSPIMNAMGSFKRALTLGVTASPFFKVRNLIRDSVQAIASGPLSYNPAKNIAQGWKLTDPKSDAYFRLMAGGGTIHFGTMMEGSEAKRVQALVESGVDSSTILSDEHKVQEFYRKFIEPGITAYNELGNRGEAINRASLYDQLVKQGMNHADASLQARDLMDFSMQGSFTTIRFLTQVVPFFNARIQGLYKLGRAAKEDPARFSAVLGASAVFSLALLAGYSDDDDWKKREDWDRNNFWWFKFGGTAFRIPKPFEIGAIATLAERGFELAFEKEMTNKRFMTQVMNLAGDNLSMNPIPQMVKPILDVYANKDSFSGRPIETMGMDRLKPEYRFTDRTSMTARGLSTATNAVTGLVGIDSPSPVQIDSMLRGYFGWLGSFVVGAGDVLARPATNQPGHAAPDYWKTATGNMVSDMRDAPSRYVSQMYTQAKEIEQAYGTWRALQKEGKFQEALEFRNNNMDTLPKYHLIERIKKLESNANQRIRMIERSDMDGDRKRELIRNIQAQKDRMSRAVSN